MAATAHLTLVAPDNEKFTVVAPARLPRRKPNAEYRSREHLTERGTDRTRTAASFEATVGGSAARGSSNFSRKSR